MSSNVNDVTPSSSASSAEFEQMLAGKRTK